MDQSMPKGGYRFISPEKNTADEYYHPD